MDLDGNHIGTYVAGGGATTIYTTTGGLWVGLVDDGAFVRRFDFATRTFADPIQLSENGGQIISMDGVEEDRRLWVVLNRDNLLYQLDALTGDIIGQTNTSDLPLDIYVYEELVFVPARGSSEINVFDARQGAFLSSIDKIENPDSIIIESCGATCAKLWVGSEIGDLVYTVDIDPLP